MKKAIKTFFLIITLSLVTSSCSSDSNSDDSDSKTPKAPEEVLKFEAGDYDILWDDRPFKTTLTKTNDDTLTGRFCANISANTCDDVGPITITRDKNRVFFKFSDNKCRIASSGLPGEFMGNGTINKDNEYIFLINGQDCTGEQKNVPLKLTKI